MPSFEPGMILGALLIFIYATERFNTPRTVRASTTAGRYYSVATIYLLVYLLTFYIFSKYPHFLQLLIDDASVKEKMREMNSTNTPIFVAMIFSLLVPKIPLISTLDQRLRAFLHRLASIPYEAIRMSKEVQAMPFEIPAAIRAELRHEVEERNFPVQVDAAENGDAIVRGWMNIAALIIQLRQWERTNPFASFTQERSGQLERIHERYLRLCAATTNAYTLCQQAKSQPDIPALQDAAAGFSRNLRADEKSLHGEICDFISQAILTNCYRMQTRRATLEKMGFLASDNMAEEGLSVHQGVTLAGLLMMLLLTSLILFSPGANDRNIEHLLLRATMIVSIYSASVFFAVFPKSRWSFFQYRDGQFYPVASYVLAGIMAMFASMLINLSFRTLINLGNDNVSGVSMSLQLAWGRFSTLGYPWITMSFIATLSMAFLIDWNLPESLGARTQRFCKAILLMVILLGATQLVYLWLQTLYAQTRITLPVQLPSVMSNSAIIGWVLGYFVPAWFRRSTAPRRPAIDDPAKLGPVLV